MTDKVSREIRSKTMRAIRSSRTKLEDKIIKALWSKGIRFRRNVNTLFGKPDIAVKKYKVAIFIDSCFWHGCKLHCRMPETNRDYWINKITKNKKRDSEVNSHYMGKGWRVLRIWEHEIKDDIEVVIDKIKDFILNSRL